MYVGTQGLYTYECCPVYVVQLKKFWDTLVIFSQFAELPQLQLSKIFA